MSNKNEQSPATPSSAEPSAAPVQTASNKPGMKPAVVETPIRVG